jgi:hypothetical protein
LLTSCFVDPRGFQMWSYVNGMNYRFLASCKCLC